MSPLPAHLKGYSGGQEAQELSQHLPVWPTKPCGPLTSRPEAVLCGG